MSNKTELNIYSWPCFACYKAKRTSALYCRILLILILFRIQAFIALSDIDAAADCFEKALELEPNDGQFSHSIVRAYVGILFYDTF